MKYLFLLICFALGIVSIVLLTPKQKPVKFAQPPWKIVSEFLESDGRNMGTIWKTVDSENGNIIYVASNKANFTISVSVIPGKKE